MLNRSILRIIDQMRKDIPDMKYVFESVAEAIAFWVDEDRRVRRKRKSRKPK